MLHIFMTAVNAVVPIMLLMVGSTILSFGISGRIAQALMRKDGDKA